MLVGVPKEIKDNEFRVGMTPAAVAELVHHGHNAIVEKGAGVGSGSPDEEYARAGAELVEGPAEIFARADMIASGATCIAYETVTDPQGHLPLLTPMSEVAGRLAPQVGAHSLEKAQGGRGVLLGGVPGVAAANVLILGGGVSGTHAATIAVGMGASVTVVDRSHEALRRLSAQFGSALRTVYSTRASIANLVAHADLVIGAVLLPGAAAPKLITRAMLATMRPGAVIVDVAIDQGGCCETSKPTTHSQPTYVVDGVVHYCVANMPGAVARTSTFALNHATLPFTLALADKGWRQALKDDPHLRAGLNVCDAKVTCEPVAAAHGRKFVSADSVLG